MRTLLSSFAAFALLTVPVWAQTAPAAPAPATSDSPPAVPTPPVSATPAAPAAPAATASNAPSAPAANASTASADPATQSQFKIVIITPGAATPSVVNESTPSLVAASMYPTVSGLIDPNVGFGNMLNRAVLTRLSYPPVVVGAPVVYPGYGIPAPNMAIPAPAASPYRFSSGYDVGGY